MSQKLDLNQNKENSQPLFQKHGINEDSAIVNVAFIIQESWS